MHLSKLLKDVFLKMRCPVLKTFKKSLQSFIGSIINAVQLGFPKEFFFYFGKPE